MRECNRAEVGEVMVANASIPGSYARVALVCNVLKFNGLAMRRLGIFIELLCSCTDAMFTHSMGVRVLNLEFSVSMRLVSRYCSVLRQGAPCTPLHRPSNDRTEAAECSLGRALILASKLHRVRLALGRGRLRALFHFNVSNFCVVSFSSSLYIPEASS